jgi:hypothetical protein
MISGMSLCMLSYNVVAAVWIQIILLLIWGFNKSADTLRFRVSFTVSKLPLYIYQIYHQRQDYTTCCLMVHWRGCSR